MILSALVVLDVTIIFWIINYKNKKISALCAWLVSISLLILVAISYVIKTGNYTFSGNVERALYYAIFRVSFHIQVTSRLYNILMMLFMSCSAVYMMQYVRMNTVLKIAFFIPAAAFAVINDYTVNHNIYISAHMTGADSAALYEKIYAIIGVINEYIVYLYVLVPPIVFMFFMLSTHIFVKKRQYLYSFLCSVIISLYFSYVFIYSTFSEIFVTNVDFTRLPVKYAFETADYTIPAVWLLVVLVCTLYIVFHDRDKQINDDKSFSDENDERLNKNISMVIHVYKNAFLAMQRYMKLVRMAIKKDNLESANAYTDTCEELINEQLSSISNMLEKLSGADNGKTPVELVSCIREAVRKSILTDDALIEYDFNVSNLFIYANFSDIVEMFVNLLNNAVEAKDNNKDNLLVKISIIAEKDFCQISVSDNGLGIAKSNLNKIFNPFYSTKTRLKYGGLGLCQVERVVKSHNGAIKIYSTTGVGTTVKIALPIYDEKYITKMEWI